MEGQIEYMINKAFFGKTTAFKVLYDNKEKNIFFRIGKQDESGNWNWEVVKMNDMECGQILNWLDGEGEMCNFYHKFEKDGQTKETQIKFNKAKDNKDIFVSIANYNKALSPGEQRVLRELLKNIIWQTNLV